MTVAECIAKLSQLDQRAQVVINGKIPMDIIPINGKVINSYFGLAFHENPKGDPKVRYQGITFSHWTEQSDGQVVMSHHF